MYEILRIVWIICILRLPLFCEKQTLSEEWQLVFEHEFQDETYQLAWSENGRFLAAGLRAWETDTWEELDFLFTTSTFEDMHNINGFPVHMFYPGRPYTLMCDYKYRSIYVLDSSSGEEIKELPTSCFAHGFEWSPKDRWFLAWYQVGGHTVVIDIWDTQIWQKVTTIEYEGYFYFVLPAWSPDETIFISGYPDCLRVWRSNDWQPIDDVECLNSPDERPLSVKWSPDGGMLAVGYIREWPDGAKPEQLVAVFETTHWEMIASLEASWLRDKGIEFEGAGRLSWSPDGDRLAVPDTSDERHQILLWNLTQDEDVVVLKTNTDSPDNLINRKWAPDGKKLALLYRKDVGGTRSMIVRVWQLMEHL